MTIKISLMGGYESIGTLLNFSAVESKREGHVSLALAVALDGGATKTFMVTLPVERAQGWAMKLNHAVNSALRYAPRKGTEE